MEAVRAAMEQQVTAWNQGDIPGFMAAYADSACFITLREHTCGKEVVAARYAKAYPDRASMGRLDFNRLEVLPAGPDHAWCTGNWRLERNADTLSGGFSLLWARTPQGWRILRDHTY
jgi:ketosteroid isomerase-like protein